MENIKNWWSDLHYTTPQKRSLAVVAVLVLLSSSFFIIRSSSASETITPPPLVIENVQAPLVIDIQGAVVKPGVYRVPAGSRVVDAIKKAGGVTKVGDPSDINQARLLNDGEQIYIYAKSSRGVEQQIIKIKIRCIIVNPIIVWGQLAWTTQNYSVYICCWSEKYI